MTAPDPPPNDWRSFLAVLALALLLAFLLTLLAGAFHD